MCSGWFLGGVPDFAKGLIGIYFLLPESLLHVAKQGSTSQRRNTGALYIKGHRRELWVWFATDLSLQKVNRFMESGATASDPEPHKH